MVYFMSSQPVPGKGDAWTFYECDEKLNIVRYVTHIPGTGETRSVRDPLVKKMSDMYAMKVSSKEEFDAYWVEPEEGAGQAGDDHVFEAGKTYFRPSMTIGEAMAVHPKVAEVFAAFRLGGCSHCGINQYETIEQVTAGYGVDIETLMEVLEGLVKPKEEVKTGA
jgi:hybrid cluster-associated redox disulfide protein